MRKRYNIWDLLGDVGGFHDGLILVFSLFMSSYSALAFKIDYLKSTQVDDGSLSKSDRRGRGEIHAKRNRQNTTASIELLKKNQDCKVDQETLSLFVKTLKQTATLKDSMIGRLFCCLSACRPKTKKERLSAKVMDDLVSGLDIRHLINDLSMLKLLAKHILTPQ